MGENLGGFEYEFEHLDMTLKEWSIKGRLDTLDFIKTENFFSAKDIVKRMRRQATDWKEIFAKDSSDKELLSITYKELSKLNKKTTRFKKMGQGL